VLAALVRRGHRVLVPFGTNHRYDFALDLETGFVRVQCKTGRLHAGVIRFQARSIRSNRQRIDLFAVYCPHNGRVYAVPVDDATSSVATLRVEPTANSQKKRIRWAAEYELPA
jgi:hypothetical protein